MALDHRKRAIPSVKFFATVISLVVCSVRVGVAQDLAPRAYVITPVKTNALVLTWGRFDGDLNLNGVVPVSDATARYSVPVLSAYHSFDFLGRSANITVSLPYGVGHFRGTVQGEETKVYRSGLLDSVYRLSVNLKGGPSVEAKDFLKWKQKVLLGASLKVIAPTGQYDSARLVNWGIHRWAFKPELGYSQRWGHWVLDGYTGVWFFTKNNTFFSLPRPVPQSQNPVGSFEGHLSYDFDKLRSWVSLDANFWLGGVTAVNGVENPATKQTASRLGATVSFPVSRHQSFKVSYSRGTYVRFGGNYANLAVAWQYAWFGTHFR